MKTIFKFLIACFNYYKIKENRKGKKIKYKIKYDDIDVYTFTFLSTAFFIIFRLIAMLTYRDSVLERARYTINEKEYKVRDEIIEEINKVHCLMFSIKPYKDEFWFNEEQINYLNRKEINKKK